MLRKLAGVAAMLTAAAVPGSISAGQPQTAESNTKEAQQPDKLLYEHGAGDIRQKRFPTGRLSLQTLINTYPSSTLLPKAHLAIAESWYLEGGAKNLAKAQDECRQLIMAYPGGPEAKRADEMLRKIEAELSTKGSAPPR